MLNRFKDLFIPHPGNNYRPDLLERLSVGIMMILILLSFAMANIQALLWISSDWLVSSILPSVIVELTNDERDDGNLGVLKRSALLDAAAELKAKDMARNEYFSHYSPTGVSPWYWFDQAGYDYLNAGENLAVHFTDSDEVVKAWMNSPSHRDNIMNGSYTEIGVGTARGEYKGYPTIFVVQLFGTPRAARTVAGASDTAGNITVEKIALSSKEPDVAPATVETQAPLPESAQEPDVTEATPVPTPTASPVVTESVVLTSNLATTMREGVPAAVSEENDEQSPNLPLPLRSATDSSLWLEIVYSTLAFIVLVSLTLSLMIEWRRHHPVQIAYAGGLITVMALLLYIHMSLTSSVLIL